MVKDDKSKWDADRFKEQKEASESTTDPEENIDHEHEIEPHQMNLSEMQRQIDALETELAKYREQIIRAQAEVDNIHKRSQRDVEKAHKYGIEKFVLQLLPVIDSLERALEVQIDLKHSPEETIATLHKGIELTLELFQKAFQSVGLESINPLGEPFDPTRHEALSAQPSDEFAPNTVSMVVQKGYLLSDRVIRPAKVVIVR